ncbi:MAG: TIR domain-containing protein, partial [Proteobacteria bacterium]|nr:TIR domain-containing protein [Burkholderiales bacterium]
MYSHDAFISYSHAADGALAPILESGLERLARPTFRLRAIDVFRDQTSLSASPGVWTSIVDHLAGSRWFVLLASPASAASPWCQKEVLWWLEHHGTERLLIALTDGQLFWDAQRSDFDWTRTDAMAPGLRGRFGEEPLYVDLRWARALDRPTARDPRLRSALLDLAAPIRGVPKDQLDGDDVRQLRRTRWLFRSGALAITLAAAVAVWQAVEATAQRRLAEAERERALS